MIGHGGGGRPGYVRRGDYLVPAEELEAAEDEFEGWSRGRRARDRLSRQPIEPDRRRWARGARFVDYPGVDTPTDEPRVTLLDEWVGVTDVKPPGEGDVIADPQGREPVFGSEYLGDLADIRLPPDTPRLLINALRR